MHCKPPLVFTLHSERAAIPWFLALSALLSLSACGTEESPMESETTTADENPSTESSDLTENPDTSELNEDPDDVSEPTDVSSDVDAGGDGPGIAAHLNFYGATSVQTFIPNDPAVVRLTPQSSAAQLALLDVARDGEQNATIDCRAEVTDAAWSMAVDYEEGTGLTRITAQATVDADGTRETRLTILSPLTGGTTYVSEDCEVELARSDEGGDAIVVFDCQGAGSLYNSANCGPPPEECDQALDGTALFYLRGCDP